MNDKADIRKAAGVLLKDKKLLITRSKGKDFFVSPGGKVEPGESAKAALKRELHEELGIDTDLNALEKFGTFHAPAAGEEGKQIQMDVFIVPIWKGNISPASEVEEVLWVDSTLPENIELGSIFRHDVLPLLKSKGLIN